MGITEIKRMNYFKGEFLRAEDFQAEQDYHVDMLRRHNESLHTWGVADGLEVTFISGEKKVTVKNGSAIDGDGRQIVLLADREMDLTGFSENVFYVTIMYADKTTDSREDTGIKGDTRIIEDPEVKCVTETNKPKPEDQSKQLILAKGTFSVNTGVTNVKMDIVERRNAGVVAGDLEVKSVQFSLPVATDKWPGIAGQIVDAPTGTTGIQVNSTRTDLSGSLQVGSNCTVNGDLNIKGNLKIQGETTMIKTERVQGNVALGDEDADTVTVEGTILTGHSSGRLKIGSPVDISSSLSVAGGGEISFQDNGQIRSLDNNHRILFRRSENKLELREYGDIIFSPGATAGTETAKIVMTSNGFTKAWGLSVNDATNSGVGRGLWLWSPTDSNHVIYSANPTGKSPANNNAAAGYFDNNHRLRIRTAVGQGFLFENSAETPLVDIDSDDGRLWTKGGIYAGNSDIYFTKTDHIHSGIGNTIGCAAIENASNYNALMILGRNTGTATAANRVVKLWDYLEVNGSQKITGNIGTRGYDPNSGLPSGWGGGVHTWDVYAEGSVACGTGGVIAIYINKDGVAGKPGGGSWAAISDIRLKKNIAPLGNTLKKLLQLKGVMFEWKEPEKHGNLAGQQTGFIAQDVEKIFPEWVGTSYDGYKHVAVKGFEALIVEALREIVKRIEKVEKQK